MSLQQAKIGDELRDQIKRWMLFRLGHPIVKVETTNANLDMAIDEAVRRFSQWVPHANKLAIFDASKGQTRYNLLELVPEYIQVKDVIYNPSVTDVLLTSFLGGITTDFSFGSNQISYFHGTYSTMIDYTLWNLYNEQYLRTIGREGTWSVIGDELVLAPAPAAGVKVGIIYSSLLLDEDIRRDEWVKEWALSEVKWQLGEVRSKYPSGFPGPRGEVQLNGEALKDEARATQEELRERIDEYRDPILFETG